MSYCNRKLTLIGIVFASLLSSLAVEAREEVNINREWKFSLGDVAEADQATFRDQGWDDVHLPHSFSLPYFLSPKFYTGTGWYRKHLQVPKAWDGKRIAVEFEGVFQDTQVYANGVKVGRHQGGYVGFTFDLTDYLKPGDNVIAVRVNNEWNPSLAPRAGDHAFSGGIYRDVQLVVTDPVHVAWYGTFVTTPTLAAEEGRSSKVNIQTEVRNASAQSRAITVKTDIVDPDGEVVATTRSERTVPAQSTVVFDQTTKAIAAPELWSPATPMLYRAVTTLRDGTAELDRYSTTFGFRWFEWTADRGFFLNGDHTYLYGANVHQDHAGWGDAVTNTGFFRDVKIMKDAGFNFIRGSHYPHDPAFSEACDELGMLFWSEGTFWGMGGFRGDGHWNASAYPIDPADEAAFEESVLHSLRSMIRIHRNHPSIIAWSIGNEMFFTAPETVPKMRSLLARGVALARELDPTRPAAVGGAQRPFDDRTRIDRVGDIAGYNGDGASQPAFQDPGVPNMVSEYGSVTTHRPGEYAPGWDHLSGDKGQPVHAWRSGQAIWSGFDHGSHGGPNLELMGIVDYFRLPKRAWYWYRNAYRDIPPPAWPVQGEPVKLSLTADKTTLESVNGTDDAHLIVSVLDGDGVRLSNNVPVTLSILSGPGEFPTGRSITFTPPGHGEASDIQIRDGQAAIEFRSYESGTSVVQASSPGLKSAALSIVSKGLPVYREGVTAKAGERPYRRFNGEPAADSLSASKLLAYSRPSKASNAADGYASSLANDGNPDTAWLAADQKPGAWWMLALEAAYDVTSVELTFPVEGNYRYRIEASTDAVEWTTIVNQSDTESVDRRRLATGNFGKSVAFIRVVFNGLPKGAAAGIADIVVGGHAPDGTTTADTARL